MKTLTEFACFIQEHHLQDCVSEQARLLSHHIDQVPTQSVQQLTTDTLHLWIDGTSDGKSIIATTKNLFPSQLYAGGSWEAISIQKQMFTGLVPKFTQQPADMQELHLSLERFYAPVFKQIALENVAETEVEKQKNWYRDLFEHANDLIHIVEPGGKILKVNKAWSETLGYEKSAISGKLIYDIVHKEDRQRFADYRRNILNGVPNTQSISVRMLSTNGTEVILEGIVSPRIENGQAVYTRGIFRNITERVQQEKEFLKAMRELEEREETLQQLISNAPDAIVVIDADSNITLWNAKAETIFGWGKEEVEGKALAEIIIPPAYRTAHTQGMMRYMATREAHVLNKSIEVPALNKKGEEFTISLTIAHFTRSNKDYFISFIRNIHQQKLNEQELERKRVELEQSNREIEQYSWLASHDLREPLRKMLTYSDMVLTQNADELNENIKKYLGKIHESGRRMNELINAMLLYSSVTEEAALYETVELKVAINEVLHDLELMIKENDAVVSINAPHEVTAIKHQVYQLFQNLVSNAIKYRKHDIPAYIKITSKVADPNTIEIKVADNGIGFEVKDESKVFRLFHRLHTEKKRDGTGVGLALCKKIVQNNKGSISVHSEPGVGTTFTIMLPIKRI